MLYSYTYERGTDVEYLLPSIVLYVAAVHSFVRRTDIRNLKTALDNGKPWVPFCRYLIYYLSPCCSVVSYVNPMDVGWGVAPVNFAE